MKTTSVLPRPLSVSLSFVSCTPLFNSRGASWTWQLWHFSHLQSFVKVCSHMCVRVCVSDCVLACVGACSAGSHVSLQSPANVCALCTCIMACVSAHAVCVHVSEWAHADICVRACSFSGAIVLLFAAMSISIIIFSVSTHICTETHTHACCSLHCSLWAAV